MGRRQLISESKTKLTLNQIVFYLIFQAKAQPSWRSRGGGTRSRWGAAAGKAAPKHRKSHSKPARRYYDADQKCGMDRNGQISPQVILYFLVFKVFIKVFVKFCFQKVFEKYYFKIYFHRPWYFSPYPAELIVDGLIFLCEFCLSYTKTKQQLKRHLSKCMMRSPPGREIYRWALTHSGS